MTFNWPDIPFSGTEVDAFVVAYKEFAQDVLDAYSGGEFSETNEVDQMLLPYGNYANMKVYLESALLYSAFIVKQRAGNAGPGTDFELGNSPLGTPLTGPQSSTLAGRMGCTLTNDKIDICYENGDPDNPDDNKSGPTDDPYGPLLNLATESGPASAASTNPPDDQPDDPEGCPGGQNQIGGGGGINQNNNGQTPKRPLLWRALLGLMKTVGEAHAFVPQVTFGKYFTRHASMYYAADMAFHYLDASGSVYTGRPGTPFNPIFKQEILDYINQSAGTRINNIINYSETQKAYLGMASTDNAWSVSFYDYTWLAGCFGTAVVISDGSETITNTPVGAVPTRGNGQAGLDNIKYVLDDYDFKYAFSIIRNEANSELDLPGTAYDDSQIESGPDVCPTNPNEPPRTVCGALTNPPPEAGSAPKHGHNYIFRLPVAEAHGDGCRDWDEYEKDETGKPFPVKITFN